MHRPAHDPQPAYPYSPQPYQALQPQKPVRPSKKSWIKQHPLLTSLIVLAILVIGGAVGLHQIAVSHNATPVQQLSQADTSQAPALKRYISTPQPIKVLSWTTVQTFKGSGTKKTQVIHTPDNWRISWSCDPTSSYGGSYNLIIDVDNSDATPLAVAAVNTICKTGNISDTTEEHQGGNVYLDITSEGDWVIQVQALR